MLFGDADVEIAFGEVLRKTHQPRTFAHRRGDADQSFIGGGHVAQPVAEHLGIGGLAAAFFAHARRRVEARHAVIQAGIGFGRLVALALAGDDMQKLRAAQLLDIAQGFQQHVEVVTIDRADVVEAEFLEQRAGRDHALHVFLGAFGQFADRRRHRQDFFTGPARGRVELARHQSRQIIVERADVGRNRHVVVVQHHQQGQVGGAGVVERFERHAGGHRAVADHRDRTLAGAGLAKGLHHPERSRNRGAGMADAEGVVFAFGTARKPGNAAGLAQPGHRRATAGEDLVHVALMADIPDDAIRRRVEHIVQGQGQFHRAQIRGEMAAGLRDRADQEVAQFLRQPGQIGRGQGAQIGWRVQGVEQRRGHVRTPARRRNRPAGASGRRACPGHSMRCVRRRAVPAPVRARAPRRAG